MIELNKPSIRSCTATDKDKIAEFYSERFRGLEYLPRVRKGIEPFIFEGSFIAETDGTIVGSVCLVPLGQKGWFEIRYLAATGFDHIETRRALVANVLRYLKSKGPVYLKAITPAVQPEVELYKQAGFEPVRRSVRITWDLAQMDIPGRDGAFETRPVPKELSEEAAHVWIEGLLPYWDWWIMEEGGEKEVADWVRQSVPKDPGWIGGFSNGKLVGLSILRADSYGPGQARFNGAYVIPSYRGRGVGSSLMNATIREANRLRQKTMRVYTLAYLDHLAPGAVLYLKSGGKIEGEYLQLQMKNIQF